jgi:hypothetical protein
VSIGLSAIGDLKKVIERFGMERSTKRKMPMETGIKLHSRTDDEPAYDKDHFRQAIGCLLCVALK